jgi:hypothetical protein
VVAFFDEGRFGLKPAVGRCWTKKGERRIATVKPGYKNFYIYSAVCPATGEDVTLFLPWANTEMMNIFLGQMAVKLSGRQCLLIVDQAGWHSSKGLRVPKNIEFVYLPPYSPELNPVERLWQWLKRHTLRNRYYRTLKEIEDAVQKCLKEATAPFLKSLCRCSYL